MQDWMVGRTAGCDMPGTMDEDYDVATETCPRTLSGRSARSSLPNTWAGMAASTQGSRLYGFKSMSGADWDTGGQSMREVSIQVSRKYGTRNIQCGLLSYALMCHPRGGKESWIRGGLTRLKRGRGK